MLVDRRIAVVIPAYNEARLITRTLQGIPSWVDEVIVVNDGSDDETAAHVRAVRDARILLLDKAHNEGVGRAILDGYSAALARGAEAIAVMAGDNQMDPSDLPAVLLPVAQGEADYVKGNRFLHRRRRDMPLPRRLAGKVLAWLTSIAARVRIDDSQCGFTAASPLAARTLLGAEVWPGYGYPNDVLTVLGRGRLRIAETPVRPVYAEEASGVRFWHVLTILWILLRRSLMLSLNLTGNRQRRDGPAPIQLGEGAERPSTDPSLPR